MTTEQEINSALPMLSKAALQRIAVRIRALIANEVPGSMTDDGVPAHLAWLMDGLRESVKERGLPYNIPISALKRQPEYKHFLESAEVVGPWLASTMPDATQVERTALAALAAKELARYTAGFSKDTGLRMMMWRYNYVPDAINAAFPEYVRNRWLARIVRRQRHGQE